MKVPLEIRTHADRHAGSNGASQAILDAACLTRCLLKYKSPSNVPQALKDYQDDRLPATARIVMANRGNGPDHVMQVAYERAPNGFKHINDVIPQAELEAIGSGYKAIAGFEIDKVNALGEQSEGMAEKLGLRSPKAWTKDVGSPPAPNGKQPNAMNGSAKGAPGTAAGLNGSLLADP